MRCAHRRSRPRQNKCSAQLSVLIKSRKLAHATEPLAVTYGMVPAADMFWSLLVSGGCAHWCAHAYCLMHACTIRRPHWRAHARTCHAEHAVRDDGAKGRKVGGAEPPVQELHTRVLQHVGQGVALGGAPAKDGQGLCARRCCWRQRAAGGATARVSRLGYPASRTH